LLLRRVGYGGNLFGRLRAGLFLLRAARRIAGYNQQAGTNKASQRNLHLRLIEFNLPVNESEGRPPVASVRPKHRSWIASLLFCLNREG
jgi:hypothetical protein